jgi:hypothetical protein
LSVGREAGSQEKRNKKRQFHLIIRSFDFYAMSIEPEIQGPFLLFGRQPEGVKSDWRC